MDELTNKFLLQIGRIEGKIDIFLNTVRDHSDRMNRIDQDVEDVRKDLKDTHKEIDLRVRNLEMRMYLTCAVATALVGVAMKLL
jgi:peptidoglycan hydrolase CwlO-like protein